MPKFKNSNAPFWIIFKQCALAASFDNIETKVDFPFYRRESPQKRWKIEPQGKNAGDSGRIWNVQNVFTFIEQKVFTERIKLGLLRFDGWKVGEIDSIVGQVS